MMRLWISAQRLGLALAGLTLTLAVILLSGRMLTQPALAAAGYT